MSSVGVKLWQTVRPHVPLIKFRKGGLSGSAAAVAEARGVTEPGPGPQPGRPAAATVHVISGGELPARLRRRPIDDFEIAYINRGGPE
ncbi:alpha-ketoglutarate dehydrogenase component 4 isoform X2 [Bacillus rossius redtenbacheri]|uniref:alpha-ketoglutarate dehydrogenase component 4 isoform X2 n=1 Tax=Bacillus rossius redtenbacheri TaxID=93214 RepID=UPI002FDCE94E